MSEIGGLLGGITMVLFVCCFVFGILAVFKATKDYHWVRKSLWRVVSFAVPIGGFLLFASVHVVRRLASQHREPTVRTGLVIAHVLLLVIGLSTHALLRRAAVVHVENQYVRNYAEEWWFTDRRHERPELCLAMSGGGVRSAAFNIGVLRALHENGLLRRIDVMSAVSGGSYALSWFLLQQFYGQNLDGLDREMLLSHIFDPEGASQKHLAANARQFGADNSFSYYFSATYTTLQEVIGFNLLRTISWVGGNEHGWNSASFARRVYRDSLQTTFHKFVHPVTGEPLDSTRLGLWEDLTNQNVSLVDRVRFPELAKFAQSRDMPFFIFNTTLDVASRDPKRASSLLWPSVFELNGWGLGSDSYGYIGWTDLNERDERYDEIRLVNVAPAISGAAVSPVIGEGRLVLSSILSLLNADLGYIIPRFKQGDRGSLYLSDGGHSENLGVYSLVRRGCRHIIVVDAEYEPDEPYAFESYRRVQSALQTEMSLELRIPSIEASAFQQADPVLKGAINSTGTGSRDQSSHSDVIYIKLAVDQTRRSDYPDAVNDPLLGNKFPQDPTADQNFDAPRFTAYRELGYWIAKRSKVLQGLAVLAQASDTQYLR